MEIHQIRYFLSVARELNFSRAAEKFAMAPPPDKQKRPARRN